MTALLAAVLLAAAPAAGKATLEVYVSTSANAPGAKSMALSLPGRGSEEIFFEGRSLLSADGVVSADAIVAPGGGGEIRLVLTPDAARTLAEATSRSVGRRLGIVVDGRLVAAPFILGSLPEGMLVVGGLSLADAQALAPRLGPSAASVRAATSGPPDPAVVSALEGTWIVKAATLNGEVIRDKKFLEGKWAFHGGALAMTSGDGEAGRFTLATDSTAPAAFRVDPVPPSPEKPIWMLFRRDGNRLTVAFFDGISRRPSDFSPERKKVVVELEVSRQAP